MNLHDKFRLNPSRVPWTERGGKIRGLIDLFTGCYPKFLFGGTVGEILPVFHFHEVTPEELEPKLRYLAENGYRTVTSEAISRFVKHGTHLGGQAVALCFDDAYASLWTVVGPLLRKYGLSAITYAVPARIKEADTLRSTLEDGVENPGSVDHSEIPFATWPELRALQESGVIDVQCHTYSHSIMYCSDQPVGFVTPKFTGEHLLARPLISSNGELTYLQPSDLGAPIYHRRSRMSDGLRYFDDPTVRQKCIEHVEAAGGAAFFTRPDWQEQLQTLTKAGSGTRETAKQRRQAIYEELDKSRLILNEKLGTDTVRHICFPWGVAGKVAEQALQELGYETAFSDRLFGQRAVKYGDNPFRLMRLENRFIFSLPGKDRRIFRLIR